MTNKLLEVKNLKQYFGSPKNPIKAVDGISFDVYEGEKMAEGKKSVAFTLTYFDPERTLTDEEVTNAHAKVLKALEEAGAVIR